MFNSESAQPHSQSGTALSSLCGGRLGDYQRLFGRAETTGAFSGAGSISRATVSYLSKQRQFISHKDQRHQFGPWPRHQSKNIGHTNQ